jgi:hypothetical protein
MILPPPGSNGHYYDFISEMIGKVRLYDQPEYSAATGWMIAVMVTTREEKMKVKLKKL